MHGATRIYVTPLKQTNFRLEEELLEALQEIRDRDGIPVAEQVRRAIRNWVDSKGVKVRAERKRAVTRKRSPQRQDSCRLLAQLISGARRHQLCDEAILSGV